MEETSKPGKKSPETPSEEKSHKSETNTPEGSDTWTKPCGAASDNEKPESVPNEKKARKVKVRRRNRDSKSSRHRQPARKGNPSQSESGSESDGKRGSGKRKAKVGRSVSSESSGSREEPSSKSSDSDSDDSVEKSNTPMLFRFRYSNVQTQQSRPLRPSSKNPFQEFVRVQKVPPPGRVMEVYVTIFGNRMVEPFENKATHFVEDNLGTRPDMVRIYGSKLIRLLQRVVGRYPGVSLKGNFIDISMPYLMLAHHYEELNKILEDHKPVAQSDKAGSKVGEDGAAASTDATGKEAAASTTSTTAAAAVPVATTAPLTAANLEAHNSQQSEEYDEETIKELDMLMMWFRPVWEDKYAESSARLASGVCTYEDLPFLFRPNTAVYVARSGALEGYLVGSVRYNARLDRRSGIEQEYRKQISLISLEYNRRRVRTSTCYVWIRKFRGERDIRSLTVFPARYYDDQDGGKLAAKLIERGRLYYRIVRSIPAYMQYDGYAWYMESNNMIPRKNPDLEYKGDIVIDFRPKANRRGAESPVRRGRPPSPRCGGDFSNSRSERSSSDSRTAFSTSSSESSSDAKRRRGRKGRPGEAAGGGVTGGPKVTPGEADHERSNAEDEEPVRYHTELAKFRKMRSFRPQTKKHLSEEHYFLFPRHVVGFALGKKQRMAFEVESAKDIIWPTSTLSALDSLILDESDKDVIKALARRAVGDDPMWAADFVEGKGEGQIFLLHGPPGTGKTFTVECIAKYTRRPLIRLTVADIGTDEREMEDILGEWLQRATDWRAIILIDEADVFLEKRNVKDLQRNSLVSVFLSCLEYYRGMIFLTTNRIGQIDDAFLSRVSLALTYHKLGPGSQKRLWHGFLQKLANERRDIVLTDRAKRFIDNLDKGEQIPWNGREIRNALQSAIALATFDAEQEAEMEGKRVSKIVVRDEHFQIVVDRKREFIEYRKSIRNQDEDTRAWQEGSRPLPKK